MVRWSVACGYQTPKTINWSKCVHLEPSNPQHGWKYTAQNVFSYTRVHTLGGMKEHSHPQRGKESNRWTATHWRNTNIFSCTTNLWGNAFNKHNEINENKRFVFISEYVFIFPNVLTYSGFNGCNYLTLTQCIPYKCTNKASISNAHVHLSKSLSQRSTKDVDGVDIHHFICCVHMVNNATVMLIKWIHVWHNSRTSGRKKLCGRRYETCWRHVHWLMTAEGSMRRGCDDCHGDRLLIIGQKSC